MEVELKSYPPFENFAKSLTKEMVEALHANTGKAIEHAEKVMQDAKSIGEMNPSTEVHLLVKALYDLQGK